MYLTVYFDGQFWVGVIELRVNKRLKVYRYVFGVEPTDPEVLDFVNHGLLDVIDESEQTGIKDKRKPGNRKVNPKRLQRQAAKEMKQTGISTKAQDAIKKDIEQRKKESKKRGKQRKDAFKQRKREIKKQKAKQKHKGH